MGSRTPGGRTGRLSGVMTPGVVTVQVPGIRGKDPRAEGFRLQALRAQLFHLRTALRHLEDRRSELQRRIEETEAELNQLLRTVPPNPKR